MKRKLKSIQSVILIALSIFSAVSCSFNNNTSSNNENIKAKTTAEDRSIPFLPLTMKNIKEIKLEGYTVKDGKTINKAASKEEVKKIIGYLNNIKKYESKISDHSWPPPDSQIEIYTTDNKVIQIRGLDKDKILIGYRYIAKQPDLYLILKKLSD